VIIRGAIVCDAHKEQKNDVRVVNGKITALQRSIIPFDDEEIINAEGLTLLPGIIDLNTRVENDQLNKKTLIQLSKEAAKGGVTGFALMPDCIPTIDTEAVLELVQSNANELSAKVYPIVGAVKSDGTLSDMAILSKMGAKGFAAKSCEDGNLLRRMFDYALMQNLPVFCRCEDRSLAASGAMNDGYLSSKLGLPGIPTLAETQEVAKMAETAIFMGAKVHFQAISSERSVRILRRAKEENPNISLEIPIHHLLLTEDLCEGFNTSAKIKPPLKSEGTRKKLIECVKRHEAETITSLHTPKSVMKKDLAFEDAGFGIDAIGIYFSCLHTSLIRQAKIPLVDLAKLTSYNPARLLGFEHKGLVEVDYDADLVLVDLKSSKAIEDPFSPYYNTILYGSVVASMSGGEWIYRSEK